MDPLIVKIVEKIACDNGLLTHYSGGSFTPLGDSSLDNHVCHVNNLKRGLYDAFTAGYDECLRVHNKGSDLCQKQP